MSNNIEFIDMRDEYLPAVLDIYNYYILNTTATFHAKPLDTDGMKDILYPENKRFRSFLVMDGEAVCGYCILAPYSKREAYASTAEATIYLKHGYTRRGIGRQTLRYLESQAELGGFHTLIAVICGENKDSINLFAGAGYEKCAHYKEVGMKFGRYLDTVCYQKIL